MIKIKTSKRKTSVTRTTVRKAVKECFVFRDTALDTDDYLVINRQWNGGGLIDGIVKKDNSP